MRFLLGRWTTEAPDSNEVRARIPLLAISLVPYESWDRALAAAHARGAIERWVLIGVTDLALAERALTSAEPMAEENAQNSLAMPGPLFGAVVPASRSTMFAGRVGHTATRLSDGRVLIAGGCGLPADLLPLTTGMQPAPRVLLAQAELFDPLTQTWSVTGCLAAPRTGHRAVLLADGRVLVSGGSRGRGWLAEEAELFDPQTGLWTVAGTLTTPRLFHQVAPLADGRVLAAGGSKPNPRWDYNAPPTHGEMYAGGWDMVRHVDAELFDPSSRSWQATTPMRERRWWQAPEQAYLVADGRVAVVGGALAIGPGSGPRAEVADIELFDAEQESWRATSPRRLPGWGTEVRQDGEDRLETHAVVSRSMRQPDGRLLVLGLRPGLRRRPIGGSPILPPTPVAALYAATTDSWQPIRDANGLGFDTPLRVALNDGRVLALHSQTRDRRARGAAEVFDPQRGSWTRVDDPAVPERTAPTATVLGDGRVLVAGGQLPHLEFDTQLLAAELFDPRSGQWLTTGQ